MFGDPPDVIPADLNAEEYLELGNWYHSSTHEEKIENARECWNKVIELTTEENLTQEAQSKIDEHIPCKKIPKSAIDTYYVASSEAATDPGACKKQYLRLVEEYPDFEWPLQGLAEIYIRNFGDLKEARVCIEKALEINPQHSRSLLTMLELTMVEMDYKKSEEYLAILRETHPANENLDRFRRTLETLIAYD